MVGLRAVKIETDGAVCFAQKGNCEAGVSDLEIGALDFSSAEAEYIVIDRSELATATSNSVALSQSAQADARAVSLVNVAGGLVANGLGVSVVEDVAPGAVLGSVGQDGWGGAAGTFFWVDPLEELGIFQLESLEIATPAQAQRHAVDLSLYNLDEVIVMLE